MKIKDCRNLAIFDNEFCMYSLYRLFQTQRKREHFILEGELVSECNKYIL